MELFEVGPVDLAKISDAFTSDFICILVDG